MATENYGMADRMKYMPKNLGFIDTMKYALWQFLITVACSILAGILMFILIISIPYLLFEGWK